MIVVQPLNKLEADQHSFKYGTAQYIEGRYSTNVSKLASLEPDNR